MGLSLEYFQTSDAAASQMITGSILYTIITVYIYRLLLYTLNCT